MSRLVVIVPLREGMRDQARLLIETGPPFELTGTTLISHEVFLTAEEAVFIFDGPEPKQAVEKLLGEAGVWRAAAGWSECLAARPRLAEQTFSWVRRGEC